MSRYSFYYGCTYVARGIITKTTPYKYNVGEKQMDGILMWIQHCHGDQSLYTTNVHGYHQFRKGEKIFLTIKDLSKF